MNVRIFEHDDPQLFELYPHFCLFCNIEGQDNFNIAVTESNGVEWYQIRCKRCGARGAARKTALSSLQNYNKTIARMQDEIGDLLFGVVKQKNRDLDKLKSENDYLARNVPGLL